MRLKPYLFASFLIVSVLGVLHLILPKPHDLRQVVDMLVGVWLSFYFTTDFSETLNKINLKACRRWKTGPGKNLTKSL